MSFSFISTSTKSNITIGNLSGRIFEDINYGGGDGRSYSESNTSAQSSGWSNGDIGLGNVRVELYDNNGNYISNTTTDAAGFYTFSALVNGTYNVRVVNSTIDSNRGSNSTGKTIIPVQTFRMNGISAIVNEVGGTNSNIVDANANTTNLSLSSLTTGTTIAQSVTEVTINNTNILNADFGFNFDVIVNTNNAGQGSLRQFILNSEELNNTNLNQEDNPTNGVAFPKDSEWETSIFMINGSGVHIIQVLSEFDRIDDEKTHITGYTQEGSMQGTSADRTINIELKGNTTTYDGIYFYTDNIQVSGLSIHGYRHGIFGNNLNKENAFIWGNYIGMEANGTIGTTNDGLGVYFFGTINSFIGTNGDNINDENEGNVISNFEYGILLNRVGNILVAGNYIGTDKTGIVSQGNDFVGVGLGSTTIANCIGFKDDAINTNPEHFRNLISGNGNDGIRIVSCDNQIVAGNFIGTDITSTGLLGNVLYGVQITGNSSNNIIGTNVNGDNDILERNIIAGNIGARLGSSGSGDNNIITGNYFGTDSTGNVSLSGNFGIILNGPYTNTIIGTNGDNNLDAIEGNIISGHLDDGIRLSHTGTSLIAGNKIGVGADGTTALGNLKRGIFIEVTSSNNTIGYLPSMTNTDETIVGNVIKNNSDSGIALEGTGIQNRISRNQIADNGQLGIDLDNDIVSSNDNGDGDTGTNTLLNFPVIDTSYVVGPIITVSGFAPAGAEIEFFIADAGLSPSPLPSGYKASFGEGAVYLFSAVEGSVSDLDPSIEIYLDDGTGSTIPKTQNRFHFSYNILGSGITNNSRLTMTATDANNNTSEFSGARTIYLIEICDNGLDDDGDGLTDHNDPDCICCKAKAPTLLGLNRG